MFKMLNKGYTTSNNAEKTLCKHLNNSILKDCGRYFVVAQDGKYHMACIVYNNMTSYIRSIADKGISIIGTV